MCDGGVVFGVVMDYVDDFRQTFIGIWGINYSTRRTLESTWWCWWAARRCRGENVFRAHFIVFVIGAKRRCSHVGVSGRNRRPTAIALGEIKDIRA